MISTRASALAAGIFFVLTFVSSIGALILYGPVLNHTDYIVGAGTDTRVSLGAFFEVILVITNIGSAVALFPILKRQNEGMALGYAASRIFESTVIAVGFISLLSVVTLRQDLAGATGADADSIVIAGRSLVAIHDWTFLFGPAFCAGFGNGLLLGYLMFKSGLVPRPMAMVGLIGGPLCFISGVAVLFGLYTQTSGMNSLATVPEFIWELSLGIWLTVKGFNASPIIDADMGPVGGDAFQAAMPAPVVPTLG